ncbi:HipA domain-containing protein [Bradyrhizobium sp. CCBAU 11361]|uniref:HipA domain-containing protein n=1 Tax=Bradyrhizobium sp. CCBAU 11361 TaxID=1630812 RepID=UPI0023027C7A|nr:HipA domain-containing protein [Bradyrhizobium sp. CCBAU 11361]
MCQAMGIPPTKKYQNEGGPTPTDVVELLRTYSTDREADLETFVSALVFNWLIGGSDAHAKNYSLLLASGPLVRLAPLYDIASILPYDNVDQRKIKLAMKVGGEYKLDQIGLRQWQKFSRELRVDADVLIATLISMAGQIPDPVADIRTRAQKEGLENAVIERLATALGVGAKDCEHVLKGSRIRIIHQLKGVERNHELVHSDIGALAERLPDKPVAASPYARPELRLASARPALNFAGRN